YEYLAREGWAITGQRQPGRREDHYRPSVVSWISQARGGISVIDPDQGLCFVVMPFGDKVNIDRKAIEEMRRSVAEEKPVSAEYVTPIDFDRVYREIIEPTAIGLGLSCVRCDHIKGAGSIHEDMFQHIRIADVVIVDISTLNANVFYELGVRHVLQKRVTV